MNPLSLYSKLRFFLRKTVKPKNAQRLADLGIEAVEKVQQGLELQYLDAPEAEAAAKISHAAAELIESLNGTDMAVLRVGPLLLIKTTRDGISRVVAETVSGEIRKALDRNPQLLEDPERILQLLQCVRKSKNEEDQDFLEAGI